jgi:serine phosphatase RsbU (regulator of sigma subunit)
MSFLTKKSIFSQIAIVIFSLFMLSLILFKLFTYLRTPTDENIYKEPDSHFYITRDIKAVIADSIELQDESFIVDTIKTGSLLLKINDEKIIDTTDFLDKFNTLSNDTVFSITVFNPIKNKKSRFYLNKSFLTSNFVRYLPSAALIVNIQPDGASDRAGIKVGDIITKVNGKSFSSALECSKELNDSKIGDIIRYQILRNNEYIEIDVLLASIGIPTLFLLNIIIAALFISLGLFILFSRFDIKAARLTALMLLLSGFYFGLNIVSSYFIKNILFYLPIILNILCFVFIFPTLVHSLFYFPKESPELIRKKWIVKTYYGAGLIYFVFSSVMLFVNIEFFSEYPVGFFLLMFYAVLWIFINIKYRKLFNEENKKILLPLKIAGIAIILILITDWKIVRLIANQSFIQIYTYSKLAVIAAIPIIYAILIFKYRLFNYNLKVRKNVQYNIFSTAWKIISLIFLFGGLWLISTIELDLPKVTLTNSAVEVTNNPNDSEKTIEFHNTDTVLFIGKDSISTFHIQNQSKDKNQKINLGRSTKYSVDSSLGKALNIKGIVKLVSDVLTGKSLTIKFPASNHLSDNSNDINLNVSVNKKSSSQKNDRNKTREQYSSSEQSNDIHSKNRSKQSISRKSINSTIDKPIQNRDSSITETSLPKTSREFLEKMRQIKTKLKSERENQEIDSVGNIKNTRSKSTGYATEKKGNTAIEVNENNRLFERPNQITISFAEPDSTVITRKFFEKEKPSNLEKFLIINLSIIWVILFWKLSGKIQNTLDKRFHRSRVDYKRASIEISAIVTKNFSPSALSSLIVNTTKNLVQLKSAGIQYFKNGNKIYLQHYLGFDSTVLTDFCYSKSGKIIEYFNKYPNSCNVEYLEPELRKAFSDAGFQYVMPIIHKEKAVGLLLVGEKLSEDSFKNEDINFLNTIAGQTSLAIENGLLYDELSSQERLKHELEIARRIQLASLPQDIPNVSGLDVSGISLPAFEVGGDFFDYLKNNDSHLTVVIGDVSGKGTSAALYMSKVQGVIRTLNYYADSPLELMIQTNKHLYAYIEKGSFVTAIAAKFELDNRITRVCRAGHLPFLYFNAESHVLSQMTPKGMGLGFGNNELFEKSNSEAIINFNKGDIFVFVTDGITEARGENSEEYGWDRLKEVITENTSDSAERIRSEIVASVKNFSAMNNQFDDLTVVVVKIV